MLDVRITGYIVPLAEQPQASLTPVISVENVADEDALIIGLIRIYRDSTGLMIYDSRLALTLLEHHTTANIAALTPFDPPAPADDDYFIKADLIATSHSPGPPLTVSLGAWHFDIKTPPMGEAPAGHHVTHEDGGSDEIDVTDLLGLLADCQTPCAHHGTHENGGSDELDCTGLVGACGPMFTAQTLVDADHISWDLDDGGSAKVTLAGDRTLDNPTHMVDGAIYRLRVIQDATGTRTLAYGAAYLWPGGVVPALSATAGAVDIVTWLCDGTSMYCKGATPDLK